MNVTAVVDERFMLLRAPVGVPCHPVRQRFRGRLAVPVRLRDHFVDADLLVVHGGWTLQNITACRDAAAVGIPYVITTHGVYNDWVIARRRALKWVWNLLLERRHLQGAIAIHVFFPEELKGLRSLGTTTSTVIAPNGITVREGLSWDGGSGGYLVWLGRFDIYEKALDILVRSLLHVPEDVRPIVRLYGPDWRGGKRELAELVRALDLRSWVAIEDPIYGDEKWEALRRAAGCVYPSRRDTSSMAVAEAIGAGIPTLVTDFPLGRLLASKGAALLCERSPQGMAKGIKRLFSEEGVSAGVAATSLAAESLSWDAVATSWHGQMERLMEAGTSRH
jgi:glycosyltransferase involved in cell wall biosynthesis